MEKMTLQQTDTTASMTHAETSTSQCPIDHSAWPWQKTARTSEPVGAPVERDEEGVWHIRNFDTVRDVLRSANTIQAGFGAEMIARVPHVTNRPILYQDGKEHQQQRKQTARYFTPRTVSDNYRGLMEKYSDKLIQRLRRQKQADLTQLSMALSVSVAGQVVGLTNSYPGLTRRLEAFFENTTTDRVGLFSKWKHFLHVRTRILAFFYLDVLPAIRARKRRPKDDVISHLLTKNYSNTEILTECVTYGAAGMVTTREFISVAAWHLLERPELRKRYVEAPEEERLAILHEILRLEPVVTHLIRRTTAEIELDSNGARVIIPAGEKIDLHIYSANMDEVVVGELPLALCPGRQLKGDHVPEMVMSFGDGTHRCPGAYIAIQETDIFLQRLLAIDSLRLVSKPSMSWDKLTTGYMLRHFNIAVD
jgi:cytochrome P450